MPLTTTTSADGTVCTIAISGRFDFDLHHEFRRAYECVDPKRTHFAVDLAGADSIDSSALGMLLLLRERAGGDQADVDLLNCPPEIRNRLVLANFDQLFHLR